MRSAKVVVIWTLEDLYGKMEHQPEQEMECVGLGFWCCLLEVDRELERGITIWDYKRLL